uniref:Uncharacterized protein n=1 Tax=Oryza nivara TaxID=4536 RepID=A0A0E0GQ38_ORYNI
MISGLKIISTCPKILTASMLQTCTTEWRFALVCQRDRFALVSIDFTKCISRLALFSSFNIYVAL